MTSQYLIWFPVWVLLDYTNRWDINWSAGQENIITYYFRKTKLKSIQCDTQRYMIDILDKKIIIVAKSDFASIKLHVTLSLWLYKVIIVVYVGSESWMRENLKWMRICDTEWMGSISSFFMWYETKIWSTWKIEVPFVD